MSLSSNVVKRPGSSVYYARITIPEELQPYYPAKGGKANKVQLWQSLRTRDPREAREKAAHVVARWRSEFAELLRRREPTPGDLQKAVWDEYTGGLDRDAARRARFPTGEALQAAKNALVSDIEAGRVEWSDDPVTQLSSSVSLLVMKNAASYDRERRAIYLRDLKRQLATGETALISAFADRVLEHEGLLIERGKPAYRDLCQRLARAQIQALERAAERDAGNWTGVPTDPIVAPPDLTMGNRFAPPGESIMELYDRFKAEKFGSARPDTWDQNRKIVKLFAEFIGEASHVTAITRKAVRNWKHELARWPVKAADTKAFEGMSFRKVIEANAKIGKPPIKEKTRNKYLAALGSFATWLLQNEYIDADVMTGMYLEIDKRKREVYPYSADQLKTIFTSPLFSTCMGDDQESKPGNVAIRDWRYWMPWIALYSGARLGEIAQMLTADLRQLHGVWIFHVTEEGSEEKSTKTGGSMRVVPVHSELIKLGLLDYHAAIVKRGEVRLFPEIERDARGYFSGGPSAFFNDYFRKIGVKVDKKRNFHSFRHGIADAFRAAGYLDEQFNVLLGHTKATTTGKYGILSQGVLSQRVEMIEAVSFSLAE